jgi:Uri superfamily endonuclease
LFPKEGYKYRWHIDYSENNYDEVWLTEEENNVLVEYLSRIKNNIKKNK